MSNYTNLKAAIADVIKQNGNQEITGNLLQQVLLNIVSAVGANSAFVGIATPSTVPGSPDGNEFYIAFEPGLYADFGGYTLTNNLTIFTNKSGSWVALPTIYNKAYIDTELGKKVSKTGDETIQGVKTFELSPLVPTPKSGGAAAPKEYVDNQDATKVSKTGNETINGVKTFQSSPIVPTPTQSTEVATKGYVDTQISNTLNVISENWVGVIIDPSLSSSEPSPKSTVVAYRATELQRTGNLNYHKFGKSRIFNAFYPAVVNRSTKQIAWRLNKNNPSLKEDGTPSNPDWTTQNICIVIPNLYRRIVLLDGNADGKYEIRYDIAPFEGASLFHAESYHSIGDASMDRTTSQLVSVMSNDVRFRGGGNQSAWDAQWRSQLGTPLTDTSRTNFELYANNAGWQTMNIYDWTMFSELAMLYFANTNIQLDYTSVLTAEGYPQGGLGAGNTTWISKRWDGHSGYYPIDKVGEGFMAIGCNVGVKSKTLTDYYRGATTSVATNKLIATGHFSASAGWLASYIGYTIRNISTGLTATIVAKDSDDQLSLSADIFTATAQIFQIDGVSFTYGIPVFFGLEHLYGHIWKYVSGINYIVQAADAGGRSMAYVNPDWATRSAIDVNNYQYVGDIPHVGGYIKTLFPGWNIVKSNTGGSSTTYMSDYGYHANLPASGQVVRALLVSGSADTGATAGLRYTNSYYTPSLTVATFGARLRAIKQ